MSKARHGSRLALLAAVACICALGGAPARAAEVPTLPGPAQSDAGAAISYAKQHPHSAPPGVNDFTCHPDASHPRPVVLVHGSDGSAYSNWAGLSPKLKDAGYCVFALNYGRKPGTEHFGMQTMTEGAAELEVFVDDVLAVTGADEVDLIGHSQGATVARYYINRLGGASKVNRWIGLASPSYGGTFFGIATALQTLPGGNELIVGIGSEALAEQVQGSPFLTALNAGGDTVPGVEYTTIGTRYDEVIQPYTNVALHDPGATNILVQDLCPLDQTGHFNLPYDPFSQQLVLNTLDPEHTIVPPCTFVPLGTGIAGVIIASNF
ncbi:MULTISPECIES: esterase/lipase family protein [Rhodococcus]|uniref:Triacylglycerol lipase n=1 Tax=Rhodococcus opacus RKJ300 = JCM 13270 TaxID=1165867 RepID=I0WIT1_RHOOP|nr:MULTISPECIES: alpha/beta fold hydrolase [Rhodococcus]EID76297.1 triacylglycerol lipase [Rhodococcus opacus RKJ300 = JCM 13270]QQZ12554.1 alpha/beta fold hydrolase [Rhodococcus sp. 21391]